MRLAVFSHKLCWPSVDSPSGYATDGGFPFQMRALSELFDETVLVLPVRSEPPGGGQQVLSGPNLRVRPLSKIKGAGLTRKLRLPFWVTCNAPALLGEAFRADCIHAPVPGDVGTFGMLLALLLGKPLFVRHCGNWMKQRTVSEHFWKWIMERFAGARNVMLATGGSAVAPSQNHNIEWIFSTSLTRRDFSAEPKQRKEEDPVRLVITCRQQRRKGTGEALRALPLIVERYPETTLDVAGDGEALPQFRELARVLGVADRVTFHGNLPHERVLDLLSRSTLFCYPTSASEGFPKAVLEALARGLPVVTTHVSVLPQLLAAGCGRLIEDVEPATIASAVIESLQPARYSAMSRQAIAIAREYSLERWRDTIGEKLRTSWGPLRANTL